MIQKIHQIVWPNILNLAILFYYFVYVDSVTGKTFSNYTEKILASKISETQAEEIGLKYFSLNRSECKIVEAYYNGKMRCTFNAQCKGKYYSLNIDLTTGATSNSTTQ